MLHTAGVAPRCVGTVSQNDRLATDRRDLRRGGFPRCLGVRLAERLTIGLQTSAGSKKRRASRSETVPRLRRTAVGQLLRAGTPHVAYPDEWVIYGLCVRHCASGVEEARHEHRYLIHGLPALCARSIGDSRPPSTRENHHMSPRASGMTVP
jgi:hypothetical protein